MYKDLGYMYEFVMWLNIWFGVFILLRKIEFYIVIYIFIWLCCKLVLIYINCFKKNIYLEKVRCLIRNK